MSINVKEAFELAQSGRTPSSVKEGGVLYTFTKSESGVKYKIFIDKKTSISGIAKNYSDIIGCLP